MSEQEITPEVIEEVTVLDEQTPEPEAVAMADVEATAREQGWTPDGAKGSGKNLSAWEYLQNPSYVRRERDRLSEEMVELRAENQKMYDMVAQRQNQQDRQAHAAEQRTLDEQIDAAVEAGDVARVRELRSQSTPPPAPVQTAHPNDAKVAAWQKDNTWFNTDSEMNSDAKAIYQAEVTKRGMQFGQEDANVILPIMAEKVKKLYPNKFEAKAPNENREAVVEKKGKVVQNKKSGLTKADLSPDESHHFQDLVDTGLDAKKILASIERGRAARGQ